MAFISSERCPLGDEKKCTGKQQRTKEGSVKNVCAFCQTTKERLLGKK